MNKKRAPKPAEKRRPGMDEVLFVRMTKADRQLVNGTAERKGLSASAYARMAILDRIRLDQGVEKS